MSFAKSWFLYFFRKFRLLYYEYHYDEDQIGQALAIACKVGAKEIVRFLLQNAHDIVRK